MRMPCIWLTLAVIAWSALSHASHLCGEDWPHWRGTSRNAIVPEDSGWARGSWPPQKALWTTRVVGGCSAPVVVGGRLYTLGWANGTDYLECLDATSGKRLWLQTYACPDYGRHSVGDKGVYSGPLASPSFDEQTGYLYTLSTDGDLNCWDTTARGARRWGFNLYTKYAVEQRPLVGTRRLRDYGYTTSPLVQAEELIVEVGDDEGNLMAFDKRTGERRWTSKCTDPAGHTGGLVPITVEGIPCVAALTIRQLVITRLDTNHAGETLATFPWVTDFANSIATPSVHDNFVLLTSEYNQYAIAKIEITTQGAREVWRQPYASGVCTPLILNDHIYWCWRGVYCLDFVTGEPKWRGGVFGDTASCIATSDGRLIVWADRGDLTLVESATRSPKKYRELSRKRSVFDSDVWPHVVLAGGRLYLKDREGNLKCFEL